MECVSLGPLILEKAIVQKPDAILVKLLFSHLNGDALARALKTLPNTKDIPVILYARSEDHMDEAKFTTAASGVSTVVKTDEAQALLAAVAAVFKTGG